VTVLVLALDTSSAAVTAAVVVVGDHEVELVAEQVSINARGHGELLAPAIQRALEAAGNVPEDLDAIVVGTGPGPYTGLRVGLVTAAVMSELLGIPAYGVCSLDGIALPGSTMLVAADARRREVYWARYEDGVRVAGPEVSYPADIPSWDGAPVSGAGARLYLEQLRTIRPDVHLLDGDYPNARLLVLRAVEKVRAHAPSDPLTPLYLRRPDVTVSAGPKSVLG